ncbi:hypothetical protein Rhe02_42110 [Rhizocola hellebori]|uniref:Glycosyl hydrolase family 71 n=1 Tax=Rhizocola hellebori TaxID=1392758 RepID=A0A8J3VGA4_9ACTN|nr:endo-1,3-alpha-glucanase family glycosylhydrolase [Rhizocola hellebori]GIH06144.1 hypothetical protein Rhe02_42110 [Rhizocola hellebori]
MRRKTIIHVSLIVTGVVLVASAGVVLIAATRPAMSVAARDLGAAELGEQTDPSASPQPSASASPGQSCGRLAFDKPSAASLRSSAKKAFAFYFPPFPVSIENKPPDADSYAKWQFTGNASGQYDLRDRPIARPARGGSWKQLDFETEIKQAIAIGLDGFIWEYHTHPTDQRWNQLPAMLAAVKAVDPGFSIMLSPDLPQGADSLPDGIISDVLKVKDEPALVRKDGAIVLAPFYPERKPASWWDAVGTSLAAQGVKTSLLPLFLDGSPESRGGEWNNSVLGYSRWGSAWAASAGSIPSHTAQAHNQGRIYMASLVFEDTRTNTGQFWEAGNSATLRATWEKAIAGGADWVYLRTWNDYQEAWTAPSQERGTSVGDVAAYYLAWFKKGSRPALKRDAVYYFHRSHHTGLPYDTSKQVKPMKLTMGDPITNDVELLGFVAAPGQLVITQGSEVQTKDVAEPGVVSFKVPLKAGTTPVFELRRGGTVLKVQSRTPIRSSIALQDWIYHGGGGTACV